jgi:hypothetical protein
MLESHCSLTDVAVDNFFLAAALYPAEFDAAAALSERRWHAKTS